MRFIIFFFLSLSTLSGKNNVCPVAMDDLTSTEHFVEYKGTKVHFCCETCIDDFNSDPEKYFKNMDPKVQADTLKKIMAQFNVASEPLPEVNIQYQSTQSTKTEDSAQVYNETQSTHSSESKISSESENRTVTQPVLLRQIKHGIKYEKRSNLQNFLGRMHPVLIHFPIALIITAFFIELLFMLTHRRSLDHAVHTMVIMAAFTVIPTALFGWWASQSFHTNDVTFEILDSHKWQGISATVLILLTTWLRLKLVKKRRFENARGLTKTFRFFLLASVVLIIMTAHLGGSLIYGEGFFSW
ncbi:MAG: YHS domain-containing protein [Lentisphaerales bacterium]|nr:YHS domain-containing protein [Lentisphaerales bacterium]